MGPLRPCLVALLCALAAPAAAETLRVATYDVGLSRDGAGVLLRDLERATEPDVAAVVAVIRGARPDVLLVTGFDHDFRGRALDAFRRLLRQGTGGIDYPHVFDAEVNAGVPSGHDLDADGMTMGWDDALGWGKYPGHGGMAILSRLPIDAAGARTFQTFPWRDLPGALLPLNPDGTPYPSAEAQAAMRLSSRSHWDVPVALAGGGWLRLLASNPTPPLFDGPEKRNLRRNHDEIAFWSQYLDGAAFRDDQGRAEARSADPVVVLGHLNADPADGDGLRGAIAGLLAHRALQDPAPESRGGEAAARDQGSANRRHAGPPARDTADWRDDPGPGNLRVDYVLPSIAIEVADAGVFWPTGDAPLAEAVAAGPAHRLVWVDLTLP